MITSRYLTISLQKNILEAADSKILGMESGDLGGQATEAPCPILCYEVSLSTYTVHCTVLIVGTSCITNLFFVTVIPLHFIYPGLFLIINLIF